MPNCTSAHLRASGNSDFLNPVFLEHNLGESPHFVRGVEPEVIDRNRNAAGFPARICHFGKNFGNYLEIGYAGV
jgi:hypothetical protein